MQDAKGDYLTVAPELNDLVAVVSFSSVSVMHIFRNWRPEQDSNLQIQQKRWHDFQFHHPV
jgi:hypothetical protein